MQGLLLGDEKGKWRLICECTLKVRPDHKVVMEEACFYILYNCIVSVCSVM